MAEAQESPTLEEGQRQPAAQTEQKAKGAQIDVSKEAVNDLVAELEKQGVQSPEQLQGMATASQQAGQLANLLGQERQRSQQLQRQLEETRALRASRKDDYYGTEEAQLTAKDIETIVDRTISQRVPAALAQAYYGVMSQTQAAHNAELQVLSQIQNDSLYETLGDVFQKHVANPGTQMKIRQGQSNLLMEYQNIKDRFYQKMIKRLQGDVSEIEKRGIGASQPPHMESSETHAIKPPAEPDEKKTKIKKLVEEGAGTDDDIDRFLETMMPDHDPFFQQR